MDLVEKIGRLGRKVVGYIALEELNPEGDIIIKPGEVIPGAETWPNLHNFIRQGRIAPAIEMPGQKEPVIPFIQKTTAKDSEPAKDLGLEAKSDTVPRKRGRPFARKLDDE